jgi:uncharacterized membrane protein
MKSRHPVPDEAPLPAHIEETIQAIARLHADHDMRASRFQKAIDRVTGFAGRPRFISYLSAGIFLWLAWNAASRLVGATAFDPAPFSLLQTVVGVMALYLTALILATQRREDELAGHRERLTLQLAILSDHKSAKLIGLLEEMRRESPLLSNRIDHEAEAMLAPADPQSMLEAIANKHDELLAADAGADAAPPGNPAAAPDHVQPP